MINKNKNIDLLSYSEAWFLFLIYIWDKMEFVIQYLPHGKQVCKTAAWGEISFNDMLVQKKAVDAWKLVMLSGEK